MNSNPLQKYFRQPKLYVSLPSKGAYLEPDILKGSAEDMPVFAMTGMDEILLKTPDALFNGESTAKVIQSCCPHITDGWKISAIDLDSLLIAIRIATYGNIMEIEHTCGNCATENEYDVDLGTLNNHFLNIEFNDTIIIGEITIKVRPLTYREMTTFNLENFTLQKKLMQAAQNFDEPENQKLVNELYTEIAGLQNKVFIQSIESVVVPDGKVDNPEFIQEWIKNSETELFEKIKQHIDENRKNWKLQSVAVECAACNAKANLEITMDQTNFFVRK
jgi:hypothetical protein